MKKKLTMVVSLLLVMALSIGGTLAYLTDKTDTVKNTFTIGKVDITLIETTGETYQMVPGQPIAKNPTVTVLKDSEACWLFVKIEENNVTNYLEYEVDTAWSKLEGVTGVYYKAIDSKVTAENGESFAVLADNQVTVKGSVTNELMDAAAQNAPTLTFTAYAIQKTGFDSAAAAWSELTNPTV